MSVSENDRAYFRRIAAIKAESHEDAARNHAALSLDERLERSWALYWAHRSEADLSKREDDPSPFYERARRLGLIKTMAR
jgi:hypothetical protein